MTCSHAHELNKEFEAKRAKNDCLSKQAIPKNIASQPHVRICGF